MRILINWRQISDVGSWYQCAAASGDVASSKTRCWARRAFGDWGQQHETVRVIKLIMSFDARTTNDIMDADMHEIGFTMMSLSTNSALYRADNFDSSC